MDGFAAQGWLVGTSRRAASGREPLQKGDKAHSGHGMRQAIQHQHVAVPGGTPRSSGTVTDTHQLGGTNSALAQIHLWCRSSGTCHGHGPSGRRRQCVGIRQEHPDGDRNRHG